MSDVDGRSLLAQAQARLARGEQEAAYKAFAAAAQGFAGPTQLLGGAHAWRGMAQVALIRGEYPAAERALITAERTYGLAESMIEGAADEASVRLRLDLMEGRATCGVMRADVALRQRRFAKARKAIDAAYPLYRDLGERPSLSDLWTTTARLAEHEGRWFQARTAWAQVLKVRRANHDEPGTCDALIRMAEAMLADDDLDGADKRLTEAEQLARELEDDALVGRVRVANARLLELEHDWEGAWEKWLDAMAAMEHADPVLRGLSRVRMARSAARVRPEQTYDLLQRGFSALVEGHYADAVGLVLHQLAVVCLAEERADTALLAAAGASEARGKGDASVEGALYRALVMAKRFEAAWMLAHIRHARRPEDNHDMSAAWLEEKLPEGWPRPPLDDLPALETSFRVELLEAVRPLARGAGLPLEALGTARAVTLLCTAPDETMDPVPSATAAVEDLARPVLTWVIREGEIERYPIAEGLNLLGRGGDNAVRMAWDPKASRTHCALDYRGGRELFVKDLGSQHGVQIDGVAVAEEARITDGRHLLVGETEFTIEWTLPRKGVAAIAIPVG